MTDPYQGPVLTLKLQGRVNKNSVKINKIQIFDLIFYFIKSIIIFGNSSFSYIFFSKADPNEQTINA